MGQILLGAKIVGSFAVTGNQKKVSIPVCIRGEDLDPPYPSHKTLGPNLSLYKEVSLVKIWSLQKAIVNLGQGAKNRHKSDLQERGPTLMAKLSEPSTIQLDFSLSLL